MSQLRNKSILVGISGGIAAYKSCDLVRRLQKAGANVRVVLTESAKRFVTPLTLATLSARPVIEDVWQLAAQGELGHVHIGNEADLFIIAPATANTLARLAAGMADDALTTLALSSHCPILLAPAMETDMWEQAITQRNVKALSASGRYKVFGPGAGSLASGKIGTGRMVEPEELFAAAERALSAPHLQGARIVVTAGPTREAVDPMRYISNRSSGKMGFAIAEAAVLMGAEVALVHGPVELPVPHGVTAHRVESALEMLKVLESLTPKATALIMAAAVADYAPKSVAKKKLKKSELGAHPEIALKETPDVVATLAQKKGKTLFVGFAAETHEVEENALRKLKEKDLDLIVANDISDTGIGMDADDNRISIYEAGRGLVLSSERMPKHAIAELILNEVRARIKKR